MKAPLLKLTLVHERAGHPLRILLGQQHFVFNWAYPQGADPSFIPTTSLVVLGNTMWEVQESIDEIAAQIESFYSIGTLVSGAFGGPTHQIEGGEEFTTPSLPRKRDDES
jgi:hypothetical protein